MNKNCNSCYYCDSCDFCNSCISCDFCDYCNFCENLINGFMCINLKLKKKDENKYWIFNKEVTKKKWDKRWSLK